jgi:histidyl-tRNA synthetase
MRDFLPEEAAILRFIESKAREVAKLYGYKEIITPVLESYELLAAKAGEEVRSRMYVFKDLGERMVALRPEFTASVARLAATTLRNKPKPLRLYCIGSLYRYDEPQKGRFREFWQSNFELMGSGKPEADAEIILLTSRLMEAIGLKGYSFKINNIGIIRGILDKEKLSEEIQNRAFQLMDKRLYEDALGIIKNAGISDGGLKTLKQLLEIKGNSVQNVIGEMEKLLENNDEALKPLQKLEKILKIALSTQNLNINIDAGFARGLEYYTGMIFEVYVPELDIAIAGGGRYDRLVEAFGGEPTPAVGVAHGLDRMMLALKEQGATLDFREECKVAVVPVSEELTIEAVKISEGLRSEGIPSEMEVGGRKISKSLEDADRRNIAYVVIVGEKELKEEAVVLRDMRKKEQKVVKINELAQKIKASGI